MIHEEQIVPPWTQKFLGFSYGDPIRFKHKGRENLTGDIMLQGSIQTPYSFLPLHGRIGVFVIIFTDLGFHALTQGDAQQFTDSLTGFTPGPSEKSYHQICDQLSEASMPEEKVSVIEAFLQKIVDDRWKDSTDIGEVTSILKQPGSFDISMSSLAEHFGLSQRHLRRKFHQVVGLSMKEYQSIARFNRVLNAKIDLEHKGWAEIALENGYYDQAHLVNDFKKRLGASPTSLDFNKFLMSRLFS